MSQQLGNREIEMKKYLNITVLFFLSLFMFENANAGFFKGNKEDRKRKKAVRKTFKAAKKVCKKQKDADFSKLQSAASGIGMKINITKDEWVQHNCNGKKFVMSKKEFKANPRSNAPVKKEEPSAR